jgi:hypothetical protein
MFLIFGTCLYNDLVIRQAWYKYVLKKQFPSDDDDQDPILEEGDDNPNYDAIGTVRKKLYTILKRSLFSPKNEPITGDED